MNACGRWQTPFSRDSTTKGLYRTVITFCRVNLTRPSRSSEVRASRKSEALITNPVPDCISSSLRKRDKERVCRAAWESAQPKGHTRARSCMVSPRGTHARVAVRSMSGSGRPARGACVTVPRRQRSGGWKSSGGATRRVNDTALGQGRPRVALAEGTRGEGRGGAQFVQRLGLLVHRPC